jgi:hypothetical protein
MIYVADGSAAGEGVSRIKGNRTVAEQMPDAGNTFCGLWVTTGTNSNTLYTIAGNAIRTYTDRLAVSGSGVTVAQPVGTTTATISWNPLTGATSYLVVVSNVAAQTNVYTATGGIITSVAAPTTTLNITGLTPATKYFASVWALTPVTSFLFDGAACIFDTAPTPPVAPGNLVPANGAINIPVLGPAFAWAAPTGVVIDHYEWELSEDPLFGSFVDQQLTLAVPYFVFPGPLDYETDYYWRVRGVTAAGQKSAWVTSVFTTVAEAEPPITVEPPPTPTITVSIPPAVTPTITVAPPDVTVTVPLPQTTVTTYSPPDIVLPEEETPTYIWAIVAIGAVLTIAVIVLIVRTRRVV